jgi:Uma2 family endonuclease
MSPKGNHHEMVKAALTVYWARKLPADLMLVTETTFRLTADTYLEPDFVFYPKATGIAGLNAATARLVVEIADSSLGYDLGRKALLYASLALPNCGWSMPYGSSRTSTASRHRRSTVQ